MEWKIYLGQQAGCRAAEECLGMVDAQIAGPPSAALVLVTHCSGVREALSLGQNSGTTVHQLFMLG